MRKLPAIMSARVKKMDVFLEWMNEKWIDIKIQMNESGKQKKKKICTWESKYTDFIVASTVFIIELQNSFKFHIFHWYNESHNTNTSELWL